VKRQKEVRDLSTTRLREGDAVLAVLPGSTRASVVFMTNFGTAYTSRIIDVPASTGYGEPVQKLFKLRDAERVVAAFSLDPRAIGHISPVSHIEEGVPERVGFRSRDSAGARGCGDERRLQSALQPRTVRGAEHALGASVRASRGRRGSGGRSGHHRR
jgi:DNA gyrase subunit A